MIATRKYSMNYERGQGTDRYRFCASEDTKKKMPTGEDVVVLAVTKPKGILGLKDKGR